MTIEKIKESSETLPIHIAFCVNDGYVPYITVTIKSIMENNRECDVFLHVLIDSISDFNQKRLLSAIDGYENVKLQVYKVDDTPLRGLKTGRWTIYAWYRLLLPAILPEQIKRVLYLDADTLVVTDIRELFAIDMTGKAIAGSLDIDTDELKRKKNYICSGVLLLNLEFWRNNNLADKIITWAQNNVEKLKYPDQDAINYICQEIKVILPLRFNSSHWYFFDDFFYGSVYINQLTDSFYTPAIIHYISCVPWVEDSFHHLMREEWIKYNKRLQYPVRCIYKSKGLLLIKRIVWKLLHPKEKTYLLRNNVERRLANQQ